MRQSFYHWLFSWSLCIFSSIKNSSIFFGGGVLELFWMAGRLYLSSWMDLSLPCWPSMHVKSRAGWDSEQGLEPECLSYKVSALTSRPLAIFRWIELCHSLMSFLSCFTIPPKVSVSWKTVWIGTGKSLKSWKVLQYGKSASHPALIKSSSSSSLFFFV